MNWFDAFSKSLKGSAASCDLVGAGTASADEAMRHYRYQHQAKIREAIEETFPVSLRLMGNQWENLWNNFWLSSPRSPRSLDYMGKVLLDFASQNLWDQKLVELLQFEWILETFPWENRPRTINALPPLALSSRLVLASHKIHSFNTSVSEAYEQENFPTEQHPEHVIFWMKESSVHFRRLSSTEIQILNKLEKGIEAALDGISAPPEEINHFFIWLGESSIIESVHNE